MSDFPCKNCADLKTFDAQPFKKMAKWRKCAPSGHCALEYFVTEVPVYACVVALAWGAMNTQNM